MVIRLFWCVLIPLLLQLQRMKSAMGSATKTGTMLRMSFVAPSRPLDRIDDRRRPRIGRLFDSRLFRSGTFSHGARETPFPLYMLNDSDAQQEQLPSPIPAMPSPLFVNLAQNQLELLAHALQGRRKIGSIALYLPQENMETGQLEFVPAVLYPHPSSERVFIASHAKSGVAPTLPKTLTKLPGFAHASSLIPGYPMVSSSGDAGVGVVEEVLCDTRSKGGPAALSVPLFLGAQTVGVLLVWPSPQLEQRDTESNASWTQEDRDQISRAAQSLSLALSMDMERADAETRLDNARLSLSDSVHQVKNPLQALRTFGKLLQQRVADTDDDAVDTGAGGTNVPELMELAQHLMIQSDRVADMLLPMDSLVSSLSDSSSLSSPPFYLDGTSALAEYQKKPTPWRNDTSESKLGTNVVMNHTSVIDMVQTEKKRVDDETRLSVRKQKTKQKSKVEVEMAFVSDILEPIFSTFTVLAAERGIDFQVIGAENDELPGVLVCQKSLQEAVSNVLDNAFKYVTISKEGETTRNPRVIVRLVANQSPVPPGVTIVMEDNGPGIPPADYEAVFERGYRSKATSSVSGTGLGLQIARSLVTSMGGVLELVARENHDMAALGGTVMRIVLFRQAKAD